MAFERDTETFDIYVLLIAIDEAGPALEEDSDGSTYPCLLMAGLDQESEQNAVMKIACLAQSPKLKVGNLIMATSCYRINNVVVIDKTSTIFSNRSAPVSAETLRYGINVVTGPITPFMSASEVQQKKDGDLASIEGIIKKVEDCRTIKKKTKAKRVRDVLVSVGGINVRVTLWDICADKCLQVGEEIQFHDLKVKVNQFYKQTTNGLTCSFNRNMRISDGDVEMKEYKLLAHDINGGKSPMDVLLYLLRDNTQKITSCASKRLLGLVFGVPENMLDITLDEHRNSILYLRIGRGNVNEAASVKDGSVIKLTHCQGPATGGLPIPLSTGTQNVSKGEMAGTSGGGTGATLARPSVSEVESLASSIVTPSGTSVNTLYEEESNQSSDENDTLNDAVMTAETSQTKRNRSTKPTTSNKKNPKPKSVANADSKSKNQKRKEKPPLSASVIMSSASEDEVSAKQPPKAEPTKKKTKAKAESDNEVAPTPKSEPKKKAKKSNSEKPIMTIAPGKVSTKKATKSKNTGEKRPLPAVLEPGLPEDSMADFEPVQKKATRKTPKTKSSK